MAAEYFIVPDETLPVEIETTVGTYKAICKPLGMWQNSQDPVTAPFSLPFTVACNTIHITIHTTKGDFTDFGV